MAAVTLELNLSQEFFRQPLLWRLGKLYNVVTNIERARATEDFGSIALRVEGSGPEIEMATHYLQSLGVVRGETDGKPSNPLKPEEAVPQPCTIYVCLKTVNAAQGHAPLLYRVGKDFDLVVNIERAAFDEEEGGTVDIAICGTLAEVQRSIAYLHTTGLSVNPRQRSVTDFGNL